MVRKASREKPVRPAAKLAPVDFARETISGVLVGLRSLAKGLDPGFLTTVALLHFEILADAAAGFGEAENSLGIDCLAVDQVKAEPALDRLGQRCLGKGRGDGIEFPV